ncbi:AGE family epimerase/isomerase [Brevundimonas sp.]|uniref:AGE family epimerase/isomerase n=1 Tax=Brevundimonas sp. TaxID=1871086 RepID=UPI003BAB715D
MAFYPVIMCGGAGTRLWPASRPSRPKQFINLAGNRSLFQDTVDRVAGLAAGGGSLVVIGGVAHGETIADQLAQIGIEAQVLLEPQPRDSAAAMAAASAWVARIDPEGVIAFVASDHYIPDATAFRRAVVEAAMDARNGRIVTLGVKPTEPSSAYGYIKPAGDHLSAVESFHEKPDAQTAAELMASGYLWNSGNFIVCASTMICELEAYAPEVLDAALRALPPLGASPSTRTLDESFLAAPKISIDYAVMERTRKASVLPVDFAWSDLGAWDAVAVSGEGSTGIRILEDAERVLTRAPDGVLVAAIGVSDIAIVVEQDAVLVCNLDRSQELKGLVDRVRAISPQHLDFRVEPPEGLVEGARGFAEWLRLRALPLWSSVGLGADGGFRESLTLLGKPTTSPRRARVQTRQIFVYAKAGELGWQGPWPIIVQSALKRLSASYLRPDGASRARLSADWSVLDDEPSVYDQAFVLFALAAAQRSGSHEDETFEKRAADLRDLIVAQALPNGAMLEAGDHPQQSNAHMHMLEAALAWSEISEDPAWIDLANRIVTLALDRFIDAEGGFLREFFTPDWAPAEGDDGRIVEPGHQFEWAWLLERYGRRQEDPRSLAAARALYAAGRKGVMHRPLVAIDAMADDLKPRIRRARLWPQTEWLKASLILAETAPEEERAALLEDAASALRAAKLYLLDDGLWRDTRLPTGEFIDGPAPASSFYHLIAAFDQLARTLNILELDGGDALNLA